MSSANGFISMMMTESNMRWFVKVKFEQFSKKTNYNDS